MSQETVNSPRERSLHDGLIGAVAAGGFFVLLGILVIINSNLGQSIVDFGKDFINVTIPNTTVQVPVPMTPAAHVAVYSAVFQFALGIGILQIVILALRLALISSTRRTGQTVGALVFWLGAAYLLNMLANMNNTLSINDQQAMWFQFWAAIIIAIGVSLVVRCIAVLIMAKLRNH